MRFSHDGLRICLDMTRLTNTTLTPALLKDLSEFLSFCDHALNLFGEPSSVPSRLEVAEIGREARTGSIV